jgi:hypothetical protein
MLVGGERGEDGGGGEERGGGGGKKRREPEPHEHMKCLVHSTSAQLPAKGSRQAMRR